MTNEQFKLRLLKIGILADILESETKSLQPEKQLGDQVLAMKIRNAQRSNTSLRRYYDFLLKDINHLTGDYFDAIDAAIDKTIAELDTNNHLKQTHE